MRLRWGIALVLGFYVLVNGFAAFRGWHFMRVMARDSLRARGWRWAGRGWVLLVLLLSALPILSLLECWPDLLPPRVLKGILLVGYDWLAGGIALCCLLLLADAVCFLLRRGGIRFEKKAIRVKYGLVLFGLAVFIGVGTYLARVPGWTAYELELPGAADDTEMRAVLVSDLHLGTLIGSARLESWVAQINEKEPDVVFIAGDLLDQGLSSLGADAEACQAALSELAAPLGVYACVGNHDLGFGSGRTETLADWLDGAGIRLLADSFVSVGGMVIAGTEYGWGRPGNGLDFLRDAPGNQPLILLDHAPGRLEDYADAGAALVLSGHTHRGQIFPGNLITGRLFETQYGEREAGSSRIVVSSGLGTWGPMLRIGSKAELVELTLHFASESRTF